MATRPSRDLAHQLSRAERLLTGRISAILARQECTVEEWRVLKFLSDGHGHPMSEIADFAMLPVAAVTELVHRLTDEGLLYLRDSDRDGDRETRDRETRDWETGALAYLSLQGRDRYESAAEVVSAAEAELREAVGDQGELAGWLDRLCGVLSIPPQPSRSPEPGRSRPGQHTAVSRWPNA